MDEDKAAAYYDEMRRKGGGAAKLKQGLGYGGSSSLPSSQAAFPSFVRGESHEESLAKLEKENRLATVRDKLKRRSAKNEGSDDDGRLNRKHSSPSPSRSRQSKHMGGARSRSPSRDRENSSRRERICRRERRSGSSSSREADHRRRRSSPGTSDSRSSSGSPSHRRRFHRSERKKKSPRAGRRSRSPRRSSRRQKSASPTDHHGHARRNTVRNSHSCRSPSSHIERSRRKSESWKDDKFDVRKPNALDYAKLIPGFGDMTPAEKVREKMKLQLSDTVSKDTEKGMDAEWERFVFNKNAPLDDDAKFDYFGDGTGARDDTGFLQNTGSTFLSANTSQAKREAHLQAAHDAAIFGPPDAGMSSEKTASSSIQFDGSLSREADVDNDTDGQPAGAPAKSSLLSDQVLALQQGSWRERALKLKQQKVGNTLT